MKPKPIHVAMLVVDANDVRGSSMKRENLPSPIVHPAIEALWEGMASREDCRTDILFGRHCPAAWVRPATGSLSFHEVPYRRLGESCQGPVFWVGCGASSVPLRGSSPSWSTGRGVKGKVRWRRCPRLIPGFSLSMA